MLPLAFSGSGMGIMGGSIALALVALRWLLRREDRLEAEEQAERDA